MATRPLPPPLDPVDDWFEIFRQNVLDGRWNKITNAEMIRIEEVMTALLYYEDSNFEFAGCVCGSYDNAHPADPGLECPRLLMLEALRSPL